MEEYRTPQEIADRFLDMLIAKLGDCWGHLQFRVAPHDEMRSGSTIKLDNPELLVTMTHQIDDSIAMPSAAFKQSIDDMADHYLKAPVSILAAQLKGILPDFKSTVVFGKLVLPSGISRAALAEKHGIALRTIEAYDINDDLFLTRFDILFGGI